MRRKLKVSAEQARIAYDLVVNKGCKLTDIARSIGVSHQILSLSIRREVDPNFAGTRGVRVRKTRFLTKEQWEYAKKFFECSKLDKWRVSSRILARKYGWAHFVLYQTLKNANSYEEAMKFAKSVMSVAKNGKMYADWHQKFWRKKNG